MFYIKGYCVTLVTRDDQYREILKSCRVYIDCHILICWFIMKMLYVELELYVVGYITAIHHTYLAKGLRKPIWYFTWKSAWCCGPNETIFIMCPGLDEFSLPHGNVSWWLISPNMIYLVFCQQKQGVFTSQTAGVCGMLGISSPCKESRRSILLLGGVKHTQGAQGVVEAGVREVPCSIAPDVSWLEAGSFLQL